ncbi:MAG TPA: putative DNA binding domain-containing protein [Chitinophagales bacterium]|mgnify:CR=1 FL=1|nr:putative DNA binding domain-containing protein [Chitinophagales bacterium]
MCKPIDVFSNPEKYINFLTSPDLERLHGQHYDWKEIPKPFNQHAAKKGIIECVSAFANSNTDGGIIILGINDKTKAVVGTEHLTEAQLNNILALPNQSLYNQSCQSKPLTIQGHRVYIIYIPYEERNICYTKNSPNEAWKRNGIQNEPFKREDWDYFRNRKNPGLWEMQPCTYYEERLLDMALFEEFKGAWLAESETISAYSIEDVLENAGAIIKHQNEWWFTNAGYLFFCGNPQRLFPSAYIRFLKYEAKLRENPNPGDTIGEKEFKGALPTMIRKIRDWVKDSSWFRRYTYRAKDGFSFIHEDEYPIVAVGEAIVNAVVHRDYALQTPIECVSFTDSFQVRNAGGILQNQLTLPPSFELGSITIKSYARNQKIAEWFRKMPDEDGKPFVRRLSEGTKRIQIEMQRLNLPSPKYQTNGETILTFQNNIEERSKRFFRHNAPLHSTSEYLNLFAINLQGNIETYNKGILLKEIMGVLKDNLQAKGWYVDRYSKGRLTVHQRGAKFPLDNPKAEEICSIFKASVLQVKIIDKRFYLAIDYKAEVKNIQSISKLDDSIQKSILNKTGIVKYQGKWENCIIKTIEKEVSIVYLIDFDTDVKVENASIYPNLSIEQLGQNLKNQGVQFDLYSKLKEASLLTLPNAAIERARLTLQAAQAIANVTPLKFNGFQFSINPQPVFLLNAPEVILGEVKIPALSVFHDLQEPQVTFANKHQSINILDGLHKFGSYSNNPRNITIVPVCTTSEQAQMTELIKRLQSGKYKYEGSERTFGVKFMYETIYTTTRHEDIETECKRIVTQHPNWEGDSSLSRIFLVSMPENKFSLDDHNSPYYGIKEFLFERGIPCQMINTPTLANPDWKDLNLALNIVAKCALVPWVLSEKLPEADFFMGIAYTTTRNSRNREKMMGFVSVFDEYGRWRFYKGESVFSFDKKKEYFAKLVPETLKELGNLHDTAKIHIHTASRFSHEDEQAILSAAKKVLPNVHFSFVWINDTHILRGYDNSNVGGSLSRGSYVSLSSQQLLLSTTGYNTFKKSLGTPRLIDAVIHSEGAIDLKLYAKHLLALTKLNWASTNALTGEPITTKYALSIAYLTEKFIQRKGDFKLHKVLEKTPWFI